MNNHPFPCHLPSLARAVAALTLAALGASGLQAQSVQRLSLAACEAYAVSNAYSLQRQRLTTATSALNTTIAWQAFAPQLAGQLTHTRDDDATTDSGSLGISQPLPFGTGLSAAASTADTDGSDSSGWSAEVSKLLLGTGSWSGSMTAIWNSQLREQIAANQEETVRRDLLETVRRNYHNVIRLRQTLVSSRLRLEQARRNLQLAQAREEPLDIATAQVEVPQNEAQVLRGEREVLTALDQLKDTLGMPLDTPLETEDELPFAPVALDVVGDLRWCVEHHESLANQHLAIRALQNDLTRLREGLSPTVTLAGRVSGSTDDTADDTTEKRVVLRAEWPIGNRAERSRVAIGQNALEDARLAQRQTEIRLQRTVTDLARRLDELKRQVEIDHARLELMRTRMRMYQDRWENGEIDIVEYIRSQNSVEDARVTLINDQMTYLDTLAQYRNLTGWDLRPARP